LEPRRAAVTEKIYSHAANSRAKTPVKTMKIGADRIRRIELQSFQPQRVDRENDGTWVAAFANVSFDCPTIGDLRITLNRRDSTSGPRRALRAVRGADRTHGCRLGNSISMLMRSLARHPTIDIAII
jgi:hypothetical protein